MKFSFQTIIIGASIFVFIIAVLVFSGVINLGSSSSSSNETASVTVWGTYPQTTIQSYLDNLNISDRTLSIQYSEVPQATFATALTTALADGRAPDLVIVDTSLYFQIRNRLYTIPFDTYTERTYRDTFVDGASLFLTKDGVGALPLLVDPLVLYYNKDILAGKNYVVPPATWTGFVQSIPLFVKKDTRGVITQTALPLGEHINIDHFKEILSALFLQAGNPVAFLDTMTGGYQVALGSGSDGEFPAAKALSFYTEFANPTSQAYSWSKTLPASLDMFLAGKSAFYIGKASELFTIQSRNPNLNFDVTGLFQPDGATRPITYGSFTVVGMVKTTPSFTAAYSAWGKLSSKEFVSFLAQISSLPPAQRSLLLERQKNPYIQVFFNAALSSFGWPDVAPDSSIAVFRSMVQAVNSGKLDSIQAVFEAATDIQTILR